MISHLLQSPAEILQNGHVIVIDHIYVFPKGTVAFLFRYGLQDLAVQMFQLLPDFFPRGQMLAHDMSLHLVSKSVFS